jgi:hypothetical protein
MWRLLYWLIPAILLFAIWADGKAIKAAAQLRAKDDKS